MRMPRSNQQNKTTIMKSCIQILSILALASSLSFGEDTPAPKKGGHAPDPAKMFGKVDSDSSGSISLEEFKASPRGTKMGDKADAAFKKLDTDGKDGISLDEFKAGAHKGGKGGKPAEGGKKKGGKKKDAPAQ